MFKSFVAFDVDDPGAATPVVTTEPVVTSTEPVATEPVATEPAATVDPFADFGGKQRVQDAIAIAEAFTTEQGIKAVAAEIGQALGWSQQQIQQFIAGQQAEAAAQEAQQPSLFGDLGDDDVVTVADVKRIMAEVEQRARQPYEELQTTQRQQVAMNTVDTTLESLGATTREEQQAIILAAQAYLAPDDWEPAHIEAALKRGHADVQARIDAIVQARLQGKKETAEAQPTNLGRAAGNTPGGESLPEPKNLQEAIARAREQLRNAG